MRAAARDLLILAPLTPRASSPAGLHAALELVDDNGRKIGPASDKPYGPRQTCGACHEYKAILRGYYFQMGAEPISDRFGGRIGKPWILSDGMSGIP